MSNPSYSELVIARDFLDGMPWIKWPKWWPVSRLPFYTIDYSSLIKQFIEADHV